MPPKRMSYKLRLHAASKKSPCTSSKRSHPESSPIPLVFPDSPLSLDSKGQPQCNSDFCLDNHPDFLSDQEQCNEADFHLCEVDIDSPCSLPVEEGKSDQDFLREFSLKPCHIVLCRYDFSPEVTRKKSDEDLLVENCISQCCLCLTKLKKSQINYWTRTLPDTHFKVRYSDSYVMESTAMGSEYALQRRREETICDAYKKLSSSFHSFKVRQLKDKQEASVALKNRLDFKERMSELIRKKEEELKQKKRFYYKKDAYVLLNKEDVGKLRLCRIDVIDCNVVRPSSSNRTCDPPSKKDVNKKEKPKIYYKKNFFVFVPEEADADVYRESVEKVKQCKVVPNRRNCSLSRDSMRRLFESIDEGRPTLNNRRKSYEEDSRNMSLGPNSSSRLSASLRKVKIGVSRGRRRSYNNNENLNLGLDCISEIRGLIGEMQKSNPRGKKDSNNISPTPCSMPTLPSSSSNEESPPKRASSINPGSMSNTSGLTSNETSPDKRTYSVVQSSMTSRRESIPRIVTRQTKIKAVHNFDANLIREAIKNERNCRVVLEDFNLSLRTMPVPAKFIIGKGQQKRKGSENVAVVENVSLSHNIDSISQLRESTCEKEADIGQKRLKSSLNEYCVLVNKQCYIKIRMAVQNAEHCNVALDSNIGSFRLKEAVLPPDSVTVDHSTHQDISSFTNANENCPDSAPSQLNNPNMNKCFSNIRHNPQKLVSDKCSLSSSSRSFLSDCLTTFSDTLTSGLSDPKNIVITYKDLSPDANAIDQNSQPLSSLDNGTFPQSTNESISPEGHGTCTQSTNVSMSPEGHETCPQSTNESMSPEGHGTYPQSTNESMSPEGHRTYPQSTNESMSPEGHETYPQSTNESMSPESRGTYPQLTDESMLPDEHRTYPLSTNEISSSSQTCVTQELFVNQNNNAQYSSSQETCALSQNSQSLTPTDITLQGCSLPTNEIYSQELFVESQNSETFKTAHVTIYDNSLSTTEDYSQELFVEIQNSPTPGISSRSPDSDSIQNNRTSTANHVTIQDSTLSENGNDSQDLFVESQDSPTPGISSRSPDCDSIENNRTLTTNHVTIQDSTLSVNENASQKLFIESLNGQMMTIPVTMQDSALSTSVNDSTVILVESQNSPSMTTIHVTIEDSAPFTSENYSQEIFVESQNNSTPDLSASSSESCDSTRSSIESTESDHLTPAYLTKQDSPSACTTSVSPNPYLANQNSPALTLSGALTSCVTRPESTNACDSSASETLNSLILTASGAVSPAYATIHEIPDACISSALPSPCIPTQNSLTMTVNGALTSTNVTRRGSVDARSTSANPYSPSLNSPALTVNGTLPCANVTIRDSSYAHSASISSKLHTPTHNSSALTPADIIFFDGSNADSTSIAMDADTEVEDVLTDSNEGIDGRDIARDALDFSAMNGNGETEKVPSDTEHKYLVKVRTNGIVKGMDSILEDMDFSTEEQDDYSPLHHQLDRKADNKIVTNGLCNGRNSGSDSDHSSSSTVVANTERTDLDELYRFKTTFTNVISGDR